MDSEVWVPLVVPDQCLRFTSRSSRAHSGPRADGVRRWIGPRNTRTETAVERLLRTLVGYDQWHPEIGHQAIASSRIISFCLPLKRVNGVAWHPESLSRLVLMVVGVKAVEVVEC
jgi:hypothetical protein